MHLQKVFVIFLFSKQHLDGLFELLAKVPYVGHTIQPLFQEWLNKEKSKLHRVQNSGAADLTHGSESIIGWILNKVILFMILFFVVSIINSLAQRMYRKTATALSKNQ